METNYWNDYVHENPSKINNLIIDIDAIKNLTNIEFSNFADEFVYDIHGLNMKTRKEYESWFEKLKDFMIKVS